MSAAAAGAEGRQPVRPTTPYFTPPAGRYGGDEDGEKKWPLNVVLVCLFRGLIVFLALVAMVCMALKRAREGQEPWEVVLFVAGAVQVLWNLVKLTPRRLWRFDGGGRRDDDGKRSIGCTVGALHVVLLLAPAAADDDDNEPLPPRPSRRFLTILEKSSGDVLVMLLLLICTIVYTALRHNIYATHFVSAMAGLYFTTVVLQAFCVILPYMNSCGPLSITMNYSGRARRDYQYQIQLPQDEARNAGSSKQPFSVSAI